MAALGNLYNRLMLVEKKQASDVACFSGTPLINQTFTEHLLFLRPYAGLRAGGENVEAQAA